MIGDVYVQKLIESVLSNFDIKSDNYVFIKHYSAFSIKKSDIENMISDTCLFYHEYSYNEIQNPYEPFLDWICDAYNKYYSQTMKPEEFISECGVYPLQRCLFVSYIKNGICVRDEDVIAFEVDYEKQRFYKSLISIIEYISKKANVLFVINRLHLSNYSSINFLNMFMKENSRKNIAIISTYNETFPIPAYMSEAWDSWKNYVDYNDYIYDWASLDRQKEETSENIFIPKTSSAKEYVIKINNMINMFAIEQAEYYLDIIYQKIEFENLYIENVEKQKIFCLYALMKIYVGQYNFALVICEGLKQIYDKDAEPLIHFKCYYLITMTYVYINQIEAAEESYLVCKETADKINDDFIIFKAELLKYMIRYFGWTAMYSFYLEFEADPAFLNKLKHYNYRNTLAHMYVNGVEKEKNKLSDLPEVFDELYIPEYLKNGMNLCNELDNNMLLTIAYMNDIDFFRGVSNFKYIEMIYNKCIQIHLKSNDKSACADVYNGIGYNSSIVEKYEQANDYYNKALIIFYENNDGEKMGETLYNMGINCIAASDFRKGLEYINLSINILEYIGLRGYKICKISKLYGLAALCNYYLEVDYNCYMYLSKIERILHHLLGVLDDDEAIQYWEDDLFLYFFVNGVMAKKNRDMEEAITYLNKAKYMSEKNDPFRGFSYPLLAVERAKLFRMINDEETAEKELEECIEFCNEKGYYEHQSILLNELHHKDYGINKHDLQLNGITAEQILSCANDYSVDLQLKKRMQDINFLSRWQDRLDKEGSEISDIIENSMTNIKNNFSLDNVLYFKCNDENLELVYNDTNKELSNAELQTINEFFKNNRNAFIVCRTEKYFMEYESLIKIFDFNDVVTLIGIPIMDNEKVDSVLITVVYMHRNFYSNREYLDENDLIIMKYVFGQFVDAVERQKSHKEIERMNKKLEIIAATDLLTGLLNRQGFMNIIKNQRDNKSLSSTNSINTILYIDLDNFKYYNDTVGHEMGDLVLVLFSDILKKCIEKSGYAVRYGGDEFILVLFDENIDYGVEVAKKIYNEIEEGFIKEISEKLGRQVEIPPEKRISCCIGIAELYGYDEDSIELALNHADEALYSVKRTTKHNYKVYTEE